MPIFHTKSSLNVTGDTCFGSATKVSTIYGVAGTIRLVAGNCL